jgi:hypothetical protein
MADTGIEVKYISFKTLPIGSTFKGYYGGRFLNDMGTINFTLYCKDPQLGYDVCQTFSLAAGLKSQIQPNTGYIEFEYLGKEPTPTGNALANKFKVKCTPIPLDNPKAIKLMDKLQAHTESLNSPKQLALKKMNNMLDDSDVPFGSTSSPSVQSTTTPTRSHDPFAVGA